MNEKTISILVIEDNPGDFRLIEETLSGSSSPRFTVEHMEKLSPGLERLKQGDIDVILLDLDLPDSSGIGTFLELQPQAAETDIPVLILTGLENDQYAVESVHRGAQDYLYKGHMEPAHMVRAIMYAIERKKIGKELRESNRLNELLLDSLPHPALLVGRDRMILAANRIARESGALVSGYCWRDFAHGEYIPEADKQDIKKHNEMPPGGTHCTFCQADECLDKKETVNNPEVEMSGQFWDIWWITIEDGVYLHYMIDITERKQAEKTLKKSEKKLRMVVENMPVMLDAFDNDGNIIAWNSECEKVTGLSTEEIIGNPNSAELLYPKEDYRTYLKEQLLKQGGNFRNLEWDITCKDGGKKTVLWSNMSDIYPIPGWSSWAVGIDISDRKKTEEKLKSSLAEKEVLLKEIHHRVKNNLQVINSLLSMQARRIDDEQSIAIFNECKNRITSISLIHEKLYESKDLANINFGEYTRTLTQQLFKSYSSMLPRVRLNVKVENIPLQVNKAIPCALIMNELLMNAMKFGFPRGQKGEITVEFKSSGREEVRLVVSDNGVGLPEDFNIETPGTLGMQIINALVRQIHGAIEIDRGSGTAFAVVFTKGTAGSGRERKNE